MSEPISKTYADVPDRERFLERPVVEALLDFLPPQLRSKFVADYCSSAPQHRDEILEFFVDHSAISKRICEDPGSPLAFEYLYKREAPTEIDRYFLDSMSGFAIHRRLVALVSTIPKWLELASQNGGTLVIDNVGAGVGRDLIQVLDVYASIRNRVRVRNIDPNESALAVGQRLAESMSLGRYMTFDASTLQTAARNNAHVLLLIGILCPLSISSSQKVLRVVHRLARPGGLIVYSTALNKMLEDDPVTDFIMRLHNWNMWFKTVEEQGRSHKSRAGSTWTSVSTRPTNIIVWSSPVGNRNTPPNKGMDEQTGNDLRQAGVHPPG